MGEESVLRGFIVVWSDDEQSVCVLFLGFLGEEDGFFCIVGTGTCDDGNASLNGFDAKFDDV